MENCKELINKNLAALTLFLIIIVSSCNIKKNDNGIDAVAKQKIKLAFYNWVENQIKKGIYLAKRQL